MSLERKVDKWSAPNEEGCRRIVMKRSSFWLQLTWCLQMSYVSLATMYWRRSEQRRCCPRKRPADVLGLRADSQMDVMMLVSRMSGS
jgi:hypothetical protein